MDLFIYKERKKGFPSEKPAPEGRFGVRAACSVPCTHFDILDKGGIHVGYCAAPSALYRLGHPIPT
jgi:hypothetical protein